MSEVTVLLLRRKALKERRLAEAMTRVVEAAWQGHPPPARRAARQAACLWIDHLHELSVHVYTPPAAAAVLRPFGFGLIRETIRPLWRQSRQQRGACELTEGGLSIVTAANRCLCESYAHSRLGVWRALAAGSSKPPEFSANEREISASHLQQMRTLNNQLHFVEQAPPSAS